MKKALFEGDKVLKILVIVNILNIMCMLLGQSFAKIRYILLIIDFLMIMFCEEEKILPILFFMHPNSALYDNIGFTYLFNITVTIGAIRLFLKNINKIEKKAFALFAMILTWELILILKSGLIDKSLLSLVSWISSYLVLIILSKNQKFDFSTVYKYFFIGFICAFFAGLTIPLKRFGLSFPTAYRFTGLLRDPNYYSMDAILLIFGAGCYAKLNNKNQIIYMVIIFAMGICSVSKMFIALFAIGCLLKVIYECKKVKISRIFIGLLILSIIVYIVYATGFLNMFLEKYLYRTETTSLFTGRDDLFSYYINEIFSSPTNLLFGNSALKYSRVLNPSDINSFFQNFVAHNTYLDIILAWGILGAIIYIFFVKTVYGNAKKANENKQISKNIYYNVTIILFIIGLFTLSYLTTDVFALIILYLIALKYSIKNYKIEEVYQN